MLFYHRRRGANRITVGLVAIVVVLLAALVVTVTLAPRTPSIETRTVTVEDGDGSTATVTQTVTGTAGITTYTIGAELGLTGQGTVCANGINNVLELAIGDVNAMLTNTGAPYRFELRTIDSKTDPTVALQAVKTLHEAYGIEVVVTFTSAETSAALSYANEAKVLLVTGASTSPLLAIPDDFLYRFIATGDAFVQEVVDTMYQQGYRKVGVIYEQSTYGQGIGQLFPKVWATLPGTQSTSLEYVPGQPDYQAEITQFSLQISRMGVDETTAWLWLGQDDDGIKQFTLAANDPALRNLKLYVFDVPVAGAAMYPPTAPEVVARYLKDQVDVQGAHISVPDIHNSFTEQYYQRFKGPDCFANPYVYDLVWIVSKAMMMVGNDAEAIKRALPYVAFNYVGVTGAFQFNEAGDLSLANYITYKVNQFVNGTWYIYQNGNYDPLTGKWSPVENGRVIFKFGSS